MIKRSVFIVVFTLALSLGNAAQADAWKKFTSVEGKFNILLPCAPEISSEEVGDSLKVKQVYHSCIYGQAAYGMSYSTFPEAIDEKTMLDKFRDGIINGSHAKIISEKNITISSYAGREISATGDDPGGELHFDWRIYLVGSRLYSVSFITRSANLDRGTAEKFFSSFALDK